MMNDNRKRIINIPWLSAIMSLVSIPYHFYINKYMEYLWGVNTTAKCLGEQYVDHHWKCMSYSELPSTYAYESMAVTIISMIIATFVLYQWFNNSKEAEGK